jgi:hypothetical protein
MPILFSMTDDGNLRIPIDGEKLLFGQDDSAFITYDGTDFVLGLSNPSIVDLTHKVRINDDVIISGILNVGDGSIYMEADPYNVLNWRGDTGQLMSITDAIGLDLFKVFGDDGVAKFTIENDGVVVIENVPFDNTETQFLVWDSDTQEVRYRTDVGGAIHNDLTGLQGGNVSDDEFYHLTADQIDDVNAIPLLLPAEPDSFPASALSVTSVPVSPAPLLCGNSVPDNTSGGSLPSVGTSVTRVVDTTPASDIIQNSGPGNTGTVTAVINTVADGSRAMTTGDDSATYTSLVISNNEDYPPATPGFWMDFDAQIVSNSVLTQGHNRYKITHTAASDTADVYFILDNLNTVPTVASAGPVTVTQSSSNTAVSSGITHYTTGTVLNLNNATMTNVSGETYYNGNPIRIDDTGENIMNGEETKTYAQVGISTPVDRQLISAQTLTSPITFTLDGGTIHNESNIRYRGRNVAGTGSFVTVSATNILYMNGTTESHGGNFVDEDNIYVDDSELGTSPVATNAQRIDTGTGDTPADDFTGTSTDWSAVAILETHDASIVAGVCSHDETNYSTGYLPAGGDDLSSGRSGAQYVAFWFRRTPVSQFDIQITGTVDGCWVELAGESNTYATTNGWWDMTLVYQGTGIPGTQGGANGNNGCAVGTAMPTGSAISNTRYTCTFGQGVSSSTATNNNIIVRFKLTSGQSITALSFRGVDL